MLKRIVLIICLAMAVASAPRLWAATPHAETATPVEHGTAAEAHSAAAGEHDHEERASPVPPRGISPRGWPCRRGMDAWVRREWNAVLERQDYLGETARLR